jgi:hypothetical protein
MCTMQATQLECMASVLAPRVRYPHFPLAASSTSTLSCNARWLHGNVRLNQLQGFLPDITTSTLQQLCLYYLFERQDIKNITALIPKTKTKRSKKKEINKFWSNAIANKRGAKYTMVPIHNPVTVHLPPHAKVLKLILMSSVRCLALPASSKWS